MRIEKIELIGFKSFADKTTFALHPGITCIVGPNGCGKSNIVDAFRWVLGEQSAKSLRGEKMEEVIFNGSSTKKPKGMAEVSIVLSGLNNTISGNGQGDDITTVSRRLFRSGESEYMINKNSVRLKDIKDVFLDTGLDFRSYSILEQGRIGEIINSKPFERRFIIEEVAGVMKYKVRKAEAISKLDSSRANLLRITDIITEVKKQINILDRLAKKAERYKKLSSEMHEIELKITRNEYQQIKESLGRIVEEHALLKEKEAGMNAVISETENRIELRRLALIDREKALDAFQREFQAMERDISELERLIAVGRNDIANLDDYRKRLVFQEEDVDTRNKALAGRCEELRKSSDAISAELDTHAELLREKTEAFRGIEEDLASKEDEIEERRREISRTSDELAGLNNEMHRQKAVFDTLERRETNARQESEDTRKALSDLEALINKIETEILGNNNETLLLKEKKEIHLRDLSSEKSRLESMSQKLSAEREEMASSLSRLNSLKEIVLDSPTWELISSKTDLRLLASISDVIEVAAEYEKAIESALSEKAGMFILESDRDIIRAVDSLKASNTGKTAFISVSPGAISAGGNVPEGVIGRATDFINVKEGFSAIASNLLGNVMVTEDLDTAFRLHSVNTGWRFVTLEGEVVEPSGAVIAGGEQGIFRRKREIREIELSIETRKVEIENIGTDIQAIQGRITVKEEDIRSVETTINNLEKDLSISRLTAENYSEDKERASRKLAYLTLETEESAREKAAVSASLLETEAKIASVSGKKSALEAEVQGLLDGISSIKSDIEDQRSEVTDLRLIAASNKERLESIRNELEISLANIEDLGRRKTELIAEREGVIQKSSERQAEIEGQDSRLRKIVSEADAVRADISKRKEEIDKENAELFTADHGLKSLRQEASAITSRLSELDVMKAEHRLRIENLAENVRTNFGMEIEDVGIAEVTPEEETRLSELKIKLQEMGPVNLGTLEEYEELSGRYEFLSKQHEDLTKSIAELEEAISKINSTTRKKLREAFEVLNMKFVEVFTTLFGGGRAELVLTDENNILESGIDIIVQPPGKKLQNIHLLSGGEKALTALSIQFASFLIKPTPLCILDEADAPLDESNTERFSRMLDTLSADTQFIVVTHNRTTMSVAQHLYGITMEEAGVSKVISMQLAGV